jgi:hypothetical protein
MWLNANSWLSYRTRRENQVADACAEVAASGKGFHRQVKLETLEHSYVLLCTDGSWKNSVTAGLGACVHVYSGSDATLAMASGAPTACDQVLAEFEALAFGLRALMSWLSWCSE